MRIPDEYIVIDTETTGLPRRCTAAGGRDWRGVQAVEVGLQHWRSGSGVAALSILIRPTCPMDPEATGIHGITEEMLEAHGHATGEAATRIRRWMGDALQRGLPLIGHNIIDYDLPMLLASQPAIATALGWPEGGAWHAGPEVIDTRLLWIGDRLRMAPRAGEGWSAYMAEIRRVCEDRAAEAGWRALPRSSLDHIIHALEIDASLIPGARHRALGDCAITARILERMRSLARA